MTRKQLILLVFLIPIGWNNHLRGQSSTESLAASSSSVEVRYDQDVQPIFTRYCAGCHNASDHEADVQLHDSQAFATSQAQKRLVLAKSVTDSHLYKLMAGTAEPKMPPVEEPQPTAKDLEVVRQWIEQGAVLPLANIPLREKLKVPKPTAEFVGTQPITALCKVASDSWLIGYQDRIVNKKGQWTSELTKVTGKVSQIRLTADGRYVVVAAGIPGVGGQAVVLGATERGLEVVRVIEGHNDTLYAAVLSPDHRILATAGYDRKIILWDFRSGEKLRTLEGHNGAIYDLDFDPSGVVLASASADETIKIWNVESGERLDTYGQCEAEQYVVRFVPGDRDGQRVIAAGADRRIRVWKLLSKSKPSVSPMLHSVFAHEGGVLAIAFHPGLESLATAGEDKTIKLWSMDDLSPRGEIGKTDDIPSGLQWDTSNRLMSTSMDGKILSWNVPVAKEATSSRAQAVSAGGSVSKNPESVFEISETTGVRSPAHPQSVPAISRVTGVLTNEDMQSPTPGDWYQFEAKAGETWQISIDAARSGSPLDSLIDVLDSRGSPILRTRLQATRESYFTFRGKDSTIADDFRLHRWEDMELNEYLYAGGEVVRLWLYPRGPDSGFKVYPGQGNRYTYFDTTATTHALNEPAWIVRELANDEKPVPNGLPVFPIYYSNDDESSRKFGKDSQLMFTAPQTGMYLIRVRDSRGLGGEKYSYKLSLLRPNPRFQVRLEQKELALRPGVGSEFSFLADRYDGLESAIALDVEGIPAGVVMSTPIAIEAGQIKAMGTVFVSDETWEQVPQEFQIVFQPRAMAPDESEKSFDKLVLNVKRSDKKSPMRLKLVGLKDPDNAPSATEVVVKAGETRSAKLVIDRGELQGDISFGGDDSGRNLPHGVYVDNIGLNGLLIPAGQTTREVFITVAPWVAEQTCVFHLRANVDGNPTTKPVRVKVTRD
jgi:WD40 repeat protein